MSILARDLGTGTNASAWGQGTDGNTWNHTAGSSSLSRGGGELSALGGTQTNTMIYGPSATDQDAQVNVQQNDSSNFMGAIIRATGTTFYYADIGVFSNFFVVGKCISGTFTDLQFFSFTPAAGTKYSMKLQAIGTTINAVIWTAGNAQPAYQISFTDTSIASGNAGCYFFGGGASAGTFDNFVMTDGSNTTTSTRTIPSSAALQATLLRSIPSHAALQATKIRAIPSQAALLATEARIIPSHAALQATLLRSIPSHASLSNTLRTIPTSAALSLTFNPNATLVIPSGQATLVIPSGQATLII